MCENCYAYKNSDVSCAVFETIDRKSSFWCHGECKAYIHKGDMKKIFKLSSDIKKYSWRGGNWTK